MTLTITTPRHTVHRESWAQFFAWPDEPESGYSFDCTENGALIPDPEYPDRLAHYMERMGDVANGKLLPPIIRHYEWDYRQYAIGKCQCGRDVGLIDPLFNFCDCGRSYNLVGQEIAPWAGPSDDTGEYMSDLYAKSDPEDLPGFDDGYSVGCGDD